MKQRKTVTKSEICYINLRKMLLKPHTESEGRERERERESHWRIRGERAMRERDALESKRNRG